jgi:Mrp family chromosome partitioning ATPase
VLSSITALPNGTRLAMYGPKRGEFEDQYALLAADIEHRRPRPLSGAAVIAFTSAGPAEGKSSTASNLAVALGRGGARVLLIDFDLRRPTLHDIFGYPARANGVTQIISGLVDPHAARWNCALEGARPVLESSPGGVTIDGRRGLGIAVAEPDEGVLDIIPSGGPMNSGRAVKGLQGEVVARVVGALRPSYDWILIDTPPATRTLEVTALSAAVDSVVIVARHGHVSRRGLISLERQSRTWRAPPLGAVITGAPRGRDYAYYGSG